MKFKTFRNLLIGGVVVLGVAGGIWCASSGKKTSETSESAPPPPLAAETKSKPQGKQPKPGAPNDLPATATAPTHLPAGDEALRPMDRAIFAWQKSAPEKEKSKDVFNSETYKVDAYHDAGKIGMNRLKVDLDRDGKWDEKWDFDGAEVKRHVAPADDESYTREYRLAEGAWRPK